MVKRTPLLLFAISTLVLAALACNTATPTVVPTAAPPVDTQATVNAAVAATSAVQPTAVVPIVDTQATVDMAVAATSQAQSNLQATVDAAVAATRAAEPSPTPVPETVAMSEEELAALIDEAVTEATAATQECSDAATQVAADETVTQDEVVVVEVYLMDAEAAIAYAEEIIYLYYDLYGELALETIELLYAIEQDLSTMAEATVAIADSMEEINDTLQQGLILAEETIAQLETAAQNAAAIAAEMQNKPDAWVMELENELESRAAAALAVQPQEVANNRVAALQDTVDYFTAARSALADGALLSEEVTNLAQLGATAAAGLQTQGGPQLENLAGNINQITAQLAAGNMGEAMVALGSFEAKLNAIPGLPAVPQLPSLPSPPSLPSIALP